jgi:hypothetical protein
MKIPQILTNLMLPKEDRRKPRQSQEELLSKYESLKNKYGKVKQKYESLKQKYQSLKQKYESNNEGLNIANQSSCLERDFNLINDIFEEVDPTSLATLVKHNFDLTDDALLVGNGAFADKVWQVFENIGYRLARVNSLAADSIPLGKDIIWAYPPFATEYYQDLVGLRENCSNNVFTAFQIFGNSCLFHLTGELIGYHFQPHHKMLEMMVGGEDPELDFLNQLYPIQGKRVLEFGPLDGAKTGGLISRGAYSIDCVEVRIANVIKVLSARQYLGWNNVNILIEDMHHIHGISHGKYDLVFAHGTYYHSSVPLLFLKNLTTLGDSISINGYFADLSRLKEPLVNLEFEGAIYRAQPYKEKLKNDSAGLHDLGYYILPEDFIRFMEAQGFKVTEILRRKTSSLKNAGLILQFFCERV